MLSGTRELPVRKAGQRCANGYLNQMGVPVLGVGPWWAPSFRFGERGAREGALSGRAVGRELGRSLESRLGSRRRIWTRGVGGPTTRPFFSFFSQRLVSFLFCFFARGYRFGSFPGFFSGLCRNFYYQSPKLVFVQVNEIGRESLGMDGVRIFI